MPDSQPHAEGASEESKKPEEERTPSIAEEAISEDPPEEEIDAKSDETVTSSAADEPSESVAEEASARGDQEAREDGESSASVSTAPPDSSQAEESEAAAAAREEGGSTSQTATPSSESEESSEASTQAQSPEAASSEVAADGSVESETAEESEAAKSAKPDSDSESAAGTSTVVDTSNAAAAPQPMSPELAQLQSAMEEKSRLSGKVIGWNKGGFHVAVLGVAAFCPKSQMELGNPKKASAYLDRELEFRVLDIKDEGKRVVVSRIPVIKEDRRRVLADLKQKQESREPVSGKVRSITDFGAFVALGGGLEGLVHRSQLTRQRFDQPHEVVTSGQDVEAIVLKVEKGGERISLSMKALEPDPWQGLDEKLSTGDTFEGKIVRKTDFGLFVEVFPGIEGLLHESQLPIGKKLNDDEFAEGNDISGWVRDVEPDRNRLSLSSREVSSTNPWTEVGGKYSEGEQVEGTVEQIANFGVFIQLEPGLTGLLPASSTGIAAGGRLDRKYRPGTQLKVVIDSIDTKRKRMSLALPGAKLEGTKADLKEYQQRQKQESAGPSLNAMAAAFERLKSSSS